VAVGPGHETLSEVYETRGGRALAKVLVNVVTPIRPDGRLALERTVDIAAELENAQLMARLRDLAERRGVFDQIFRPDGTFRDYGAYQRRPDDRAALAGWYTPTLMESPSLAGR
jgi:hypothetical protein